MKDRNDTLLIAAKQGDKTALTLLCEEFTPLIRATVRHYPGRYKEQEDLLQEGFMSFIEAVLTFDDARGVYFAHYAKQRVHQGIYSSVRKTESTLKRHEGSLPDDWETFITDAGSIGTSSNDALAVAEWHDILACLSARERQYVTMVLVKGYTMRDVSEYEGVSIETVKTWKKRAVKKLQRAIQELL